MAGDVCEKDCDKDNETLASAIAGDDCEKDCDKDKETLAIA
jgi:hypothetical protein